MGVPKSVFEVRREANEHMGERVLGYRMQQVRAFIEANGEVSYGELARSLGFYDRAGAMRAVKRLRARGA